MKKINMVSIESLLDGVGFGDNELARNLNDYRESDMYIGDAVVEIADGNVSIYYSDILNFISENVEAVEDAINEFGWDGCGGTLHKAGQMAEFLQNEREIYDHLEDAMLLLAVDHLRYDRNEDSEICEELADLIREWASEIGNNDRCSEMAERIDRWFEEGAA